jgi:hypothetical protein
MAFDEEKNSVSPKPSSCVNDRRVDKNPCLQAGGDIRGAMLGAARHNSCSRLQGR